MPTRVTLRSLLYSVCDHGRFPVIAESTRCHVLTNEINHASTLAANISMRMRISIVKNCHGVQFHNS